jgi:hypothetical protein
VTHFEIASAYIPQVDLAPAPGKTDAPKSGSPKPEGAGVKSGPKPGGPKVPAAKPGLPKPAAFRSPLQADRKAH